ncbi:APC family permease [Halococcus sp. AFM35]|uniref:APC family permease n=1 Tax=Halococcus sp. AFM35 TaxID=3421653 RepID=UPI003EB6989F
MSRSTTDGSLERVLSRWQLFAIGFGAIVGWGWIIQMGYWIDEAGPYGAMVAFAIGGVLVLLVALIYGELVSAMPFAGGEHVYTHRAFGPVVSFICSWSLLLGYMGVVGFQSIAIGIGFSYLIPGFDVLKLWTFAGQTVYGSWVAVGFVGIIAITYMNYRGVEITAQVQLILATVVGISGIALVTGALTVGPSVSNAAFGGAPVLGITTVAIQVPMLFVGFDVIPQAAEEADMSSRSLALVLLAVVATVGLFYIVSIWAAGQAVPAGALGDSLVPAATAMSAVFSSTVAGKLMTLVGIGALLTSWSAFVIGASRVVFAMADSGLLPESLATVHPEYNTPSRAIVLIGVLSMAAPWFGANFVSSIINADVMFGIVLAWFTVALSFVALRYNEPELERPFKLPGGYAFGIAAMAVTLFFIALYMPGAPSALLWPREWMIVLAWVVLGAVLFGLSRRTTTETTIEEAGQPSSDR